jgi:hypothetical protein
MLPAGFEPTIPASERPQTHALDHAATGNGFNTFHVYLFSNQKKFLVTNRIWSNFRNNAMFCTHRRLASYIHLS